MSVSIARRLLLDAADAEVIDLFGDDRVLVDALRRGHLGAKAAFFDRFAGPVRRVITRVLGGGPDVDDLVQDTFVAALGSIDGLDDPRALRGWITKVAVFTARSEIRRRTRRRWLRFFAPEDVPEVPTSAIDPETTAAARATYAVLGRMPIDERVPFALRLLDGMELTEVAAAEGVSLATIKRRLARAEARFRALAAREPALRPWLGGER